MRGQVAPRAPRSKRRQRRGAQAPEIRSITYQVNQRGEVVRVCIDKTRRAA